MYAVAAVNGWGGVMVQRVSTSPFRKSNAQNPGLLQSARLTPRRALSRTRYDHVDGCSTQRKLYRGRARKKQCLWQERRWVQRFFLQTHCSLFRLLPIAPPAATAAATLHQHRPVALAAMVSICDDLVTLITYGHCGLTHRLLLPP